MASSNLPSVSVSNGESEFRYYCHRCRMYVNIDIDTNTCSRCNEGFIEKIRIEPVNESSYSDASQVLGFSSTAGDGRREVPSYIMRQVSLDRQNNRTGATLVSDSPLSPSRVSTFIPSSHRILSSLASHSRRRELRHRFETGPVRETEEGSNGNQAEDRGTSQPTGRPERRIFYQLDRGTAFDWIESFGNPNRDENTIADLLFQILAYDGSVVPATDALLNSLERVKYTEDLSKKETCCPVCLEDFKPDTDVIPLACEHFFHTECITHWLRLHNTCPVCRTVLD